MFVLLRIREGSTIIKDWYGVKKAYENRTFADLFDDFRNGTLDNRNPIEINNSILSVFVGPKKTELTQLSPDCYVGETVACLGNFIDFCVVVKEDTPPPSEGGIQNDFFKVMMTAANKAKHLPPKKIPINSKAKLINDVISWLEKQNVGFMSTNVSTLGTQLLNCLSDILWYIDGNHDTLAGRACAVPESLQHFQHYYEPQKRKRKKISKDNLREETLRNHATSVLLLTEKSFFQREMWAGVKQVLVDLGDSLTRYADHLRKKKDVEGDCKRVKGAADRETYEVLGQKTHILPGPLSRYQALHTAVIASDPYEKICVNDFAPGDPRRRHDYVKGLVVPVKCVKFTYSGTKEHLIFVWKVNTSHTESQILNENMKLASEIRQSLPLYHTRAMRREFLSLFGRQINGKAGFLREAYRRLTGDCSASVNFSMNETDKKITEILDLEDPDIICDMRINNEGRPEKYEVFLEECQKHIVGNLETAVDDRRHDKVTNEGDTITHFADAFSVRDFYDQVVGKCPPNTPLPSKEWLRLQFWPKNCHNKSSVKYTGKLKIKFMVQCRQFRKTHEDIHYAWALFRYEKEFCVKYREYCNFICVDDKHKLKIGEPGFPVATVERGKPVLVSIGKIFEVCDHDFTKFSMTPSVALSVDIPRCIEDTFYGGNVYVWLKESAFEASSPYRHAAEMQHILDIEKPIVAIYSDGGPDHRVIYGSVQISLINMFLAGDYDMLIACRTPPCNSWKNPAERIMSVLNIGFQSVGLMRTPSDDEMEKVLSSASSLGQVREIAEKNPGIVDYVKESVQPVKDLLNNVINRLKWKGNNLRSQTAAFYEEIADLAREVNRIEQIDPLHTTQKDLKSKTVLHNFVCKHCKVRHYMFSVKKCGLATCPICKAPRLPADIFEKLNHLPDPVPGDGESYKSFDEVYGLDTSEKYRPSMKDNSNVGGSGMPFSPSSQYAKNVEMVILCAMCEKPRLLFSKNVVRGANRTQLSRSLADIEYSCGSTFTDIECDNDHILKRVFVRQNLKCSDPIEFAYYTAGFESVCFYCGVDQEDQHPDHYPICDDCASGGKNPFPRRKRLPARRN